MADISSTHRWAADPGADPLERAVEEIGDRWMLLIIWAAFNGTSRFDDFQRDLSVARNILSNRLRRLVEQGILQKRPVREGARRMQYALTDKGRALRGTLEGLRGWGDAWTEGAASGGAKDLADGVD
ncbi:MAG: helix-turn-helix domain-containing protein [Pseudomonadota bacterium]